MSGANFNVTDNPSLRRENVQSGTIHLNNSKNAKVDFLWKFKKIPRVVLTLGDNSVSVPWRTVITKEKFRLRLKVKFTGDIDWIAIER